MQKPYLTKGAELCPIAAGTDPAEHLSTSTARLISEEPLYAQSSSWI